MYKQIYVNGSSFTHGYGLDIPDFLKELNKVNPLYPKWDSPKEELVKFRKENNWPAILENYTNIPVINEADFGGSFERVIRMTFEFISSHENPSEVLYILEIPNSVRKDVWSNTDKKFKKVTGETSGWEYYTDSEVYAIQNWYSMFEDNSVNFKKELVTLFGFTAFLKQKKCDFLILPTEQLLHIFDVHAKDIEESYKRKMVNIFGNELSNIDKNIIKFEVNKENHGGSLLKNDSSNFCEYEFFSTNLLVYYQGFLKGRIDDECPNVNDGHPNLNAHKKIGESIYKYLQYFLKIK